MLSQEKQIKEYEKTLEQLRSQHKEDGIWSEEEILSLETKLEELKKNLYSQLTPWDRVQICRHPDRPKASDFIQHLCESFTEIFGDRLFRDDPAIITGFAKIGGEKFVILAQEKGKDTNSRIYRNFGMPHPEGYRKAQRVMKLAEKFNIPILSLIDTPGAYPGLDAEERGQGRAIADNLYTMAALKVPIISLVIGEGCSGGALGIGVSDVIAMLEHAYYSVISPEGCASILWRDADKKEEASQRLKMHAEDLISLGIVDDMIQEPQGGAHKDPDALYKDVKTYLLKTRESLMAVPREELVESRYQKYRKIGSYKIQKSHSIKGES